MGQQRSEPPRSHPHDGEAPPSERPEDTSLVGQRHGHDNPADQARRRPGAGRRARALQEPDRALPQGQGHEQPGRERTADGRAHSRHDGEP
eukprot:2667768-Pyramimonas_sp.AAC.1